MKWNQVQFHLNGIHIVQHQQPSIDPVPVSTKTKCYKQTMFSFLVSTIFVCKNCLYIPEGNSRPKWWFIYLHICKMDCKLFGICDWLFGALINGEGDYDYGERIRLGRFRRATEMENIHVCLAWSPGGNGRTVAVESETSRSARMQSQELTVSSNQSIIQQYVLCNLNMMIV